MAGGRGHVLEKFMRMFSAFSLSMSFKPNPCFQIHLFQEAFSACPNLASLPLRAPGISPRVCPTRVSIRHVISSRSKVSISKEPDIDSCLSQGVKHIMNIQPRLPALRSSCSTSLNEAEGRITLPGGLGQVTYSLRASISLLGKWAQ